MHTKDFVCCEICRRRVIKILNLIVADIKCWYSNIRIKNCLDNDSKTPITQVIVCKIEILNVLATFMARTS